MSAAPDSAVRAPRRHALIPAAGVGARMGGGTPKQYLPVGGRPMIVHAIDAFAALPEIDRIVVVIAADDAWFDEAVPRAGRSERLLVVRNGGATRDASVVNGLEALAEAVEPADDDWIMVHDAARCGITAALIARLIEEVGDDPVGGLLAVPLDDTVKRQAEASGTTAASVAETVDRRGLWRAQTPQMFRHRVLRNALVAARASSLVVTDEASAIEAVGQRALLVRGAPGNFKVTTAEDLRMMDRLLSDRPTPTA